MTMAMSLSLGTFLVKTPKPSSSLLPAPLRLPRRADLSLAYGSLAFRTKHPSLVPFAAPREESKHSGGVDEGHEDLKRKTEESEEAWKQTVDLFLEKAYKMQEISQDAFEVYSEKAKVILKETSEQFKVQAEKARYDLTILAKEISEEGKEYLSVAAENSPEQMKDIVETFSSPNDDLRDVSQVRDFYLGIPYGLLLSLGGFLSFMLTGSTAAIRFGVILGGTLLALSISSLRSYKRGESSPLFLKGQTGIAGILFLREARMLSRRPSLWSFITAVISGAMVAFYLYKIYQNGLPKRSNYEDHSTETN